MGDHRASIKIEMEFHGIKDKADMWINYNGHGEVEGVDERIIEFCRDIYERGMVAYQDIRTKAYEQENKAKIEAEERAMFERLKEKYEGKEQL